MKNIMFKNSRFSFHILHFLYWKLTFKLGNGLFIYNYNKHTNSTYSVTRITFEITVYTAFNRELFFGLCNIFTVLYCTGAPLFGQSEIKLAFSVFPHCGESSMRTPLWRAGLVCNAGTTQSKAGSANTNGLVQELAIWKCIYAV